MLTKNICSIFVILISIISIKCDKYLTEKPAILEDCFLSDKNFGKCFAKNIQVLFVEWKDGLPGYSSLGKLDPLMVKRVKVHQDASSGPISLNMDLKDMLVTGASKAVINEAKIDQKKWILDVKFFTPKMQFDTDYKVKGRILTLNLNGHGKAYFEAEKISMSLRAHLKLRDQDNHIFTEVESLVAKIDDIGHFHVQINNLFNGQKELEEAANALFNENWRDIYETLRPVIEQTVGKILEDRMQKIFHYLPADYVVADIPKASDVYG